MPRLVENTRHLTVTERAEIIARAVSDPTLSGAQLAKEYDVTARQVQRVLKQAGVGRKHGGARAGAGQVGYGGGKEVAEQRHELTPEMVWVIALSRLYFLGQNEQQYAAMRKRHPTLKAKQRSAPARLEEIADVAAVFYPHLRGLKTDGHDMGDHVLAMANESINAILEHSPIDDPVHRLDVMAAIEQQAAEGGMAPGGRRVAAILEPEMQEEGWAEWTRRGARRSPAAAEEAALEIATEAVAPAPEVLADIPEEEREEFLQQWLREQREHAAGVKRIDPVTYLKLVELEKNIDALRAQRRREELQRAGTRMLTPKPRPRADNPTSKAEDAMANALAGLLVSRSYVGPRSRLGPPIRPRGRKRRTKPATRQERRASFRRLMRL